MPLELKSSQKTFRQPCDLLYVFGFNSPNAGACLTSEDIQGCKCHSVLLFCWNHSLPQLIVPAWKFTMKFCRDLLCIMTAPKTLFSKDPTFTRFSMRQIVLKSEYRVFQNQIELLGAGSAYARLMVAIWLSFLPFNAPLLGGTQVKFDMRGGRGVQSIAPGDCP